MTSPALTRWPDDTPPTEDALERIFRQEGLSPRRWSNGPGDRYGTHSHPYHKVLYCARGSIRFVLENRGQPLDLKPGDRLDIPPGTAHSAVVGPQGVSCAEAARP
ncbi:MAG: AraC family ligand binding domain-containing protein [Dehalococcoidia bacterium]|nr:AraC family ligand binding domain-containing protein [Dehalococcoidia bacterium]